ncbi:MAG: PhzF family phenazine biosynthesis protein [Cyanobium sp.]
MKPAAPDAVQRLPAVLIEAFTGVPHQGNGAAVVLLSTPATAAWMQAVAGSLRQSETAFLLRWEGQWLLRWFTPSCEVPLCGHATLAAVLALGHWQLLAAGELIRFHSHSGPLPCQCLLAPASGRAGRARIELPGGDLIAAPPPPLLERVLAAALGCAPLAFWRSELGYAVALVPEHAPLAEGLGIAAGLDDDLGRGLVLMQAAGLKGEGGPIGRSSDEPPGLEDLEAQADYRLRFFAPCLGIAEDPVTGSAHALVARWWQERLGRHRLVGWQCSDRPGGLVSDGGPSGMIRLTGQGVLLWDGHLNGQPSACASAGGWPINGLAP